MPQEAIWKTGASVLQSVKAFFHIVKSYPAVWIGFACVCAWPWSCTSATLIYENAITVGSPVWLGSNFTYFIIGLSGLAIGLGFKKRGTVAPPVVVALLAGVCYVAASVLFVLLSKMPNTVIDANYLVIAFVWPLFAGFGQALLFVQWVSAFGAVGPRKAIALVIASSLLGAGAIFSLNFIPQDVRDVMPVIIGVIASICVVMMCRLLPKGRGGGQAYSPIGAEI